MRLLLAALFLVAMTLQAQAEDLSLKRVMLSSGGVGYFEYTANVDGDAELGLDVPLQEVDDILMSLVVFDGAGSIANVELPGKDNTTAAFGDVPFGPEALQSPTEYLNALRGTEVTVQGPRPMTGRIVRAEAVPETQDNIASQHTRVTLLADEGLRQFVLEDADSVQVVDPALRERIARALDAMRRDAGRTTRHLTLRVKGKGERMVTVGYVASAPLWKATYRLVLPRGDGAPARIQGWATLENQTGNDWKDVSLTLRYGNPVTFRQSLYRSYFVDRPEVPVEILGHILPDVDTKAAGGKFTETLKEEPQGAGGVAGTDQAAAPAPIAAPAGIAMARYARMRQEMAAPAEAATAAESAEETIFALAQPIDLAAGHTANVPILDRSVPATRVGLVPWGQDRPLSSIRIKNDGGQSLPAGVLTLYDAAGDAGFVGDARLGGLPAGETRLLSFARDLRTTIETRNGGARTTVTSIAAANGQLTGTMQEHIEIVFKVTAPAKEARDLLVEVPKQMTAQTIGIDDPKLRVAEETASAWRIALKLAPGETRQFTVSLDRPILQTFRLIDGSWEGMAFEIAGAAKLPAATRAALTHIRDLRTDSAEKRNAVDRLRKSMDDLQMDEDRVRKNLGAVSQADALRTRLTRTLDADETRIEQLQKSIGDATAAAEAADKTLADGVAMLKL